MGFVDNNSFGKFEAVVNRPLPAFSAESLYSLPTKQFGAATLDAVSVTNFDPINFSKFHVGDGGTGAGNHTTNAPTGGIKTRGDKGFHFIMNAAAALKSQVVKIKKGSVTKQFILSPGDTLSRRGQDTNIDYTPAGGQTVSTDFPALRANNATDFYNIDLGEAVAAPAEPADSGSSTCSTENRVANTDDTCGDCLAGFTEDDTGVCVADADTDEEETNWLLYGGIAALVVVGGVMAKKMMNK